MEKEKIESNYNFEDVRELFIDKPNVILDEECFADEEFLEPEEDIDFYNAIEEYRNQTAKCLCNYLAFEKKARGEEVHKREIEFISMAAKGLGTLAKDVYWKGFRAGKESI